MTTITPDQLEKKLLTVDQVVNRLEKTEPLTVETIDSNSKIVFGLDTDWASGIDGMEGTERVGVNMRINGTDRPMTKAAALQAAAHFGITAPLMKKAPAKHIEGLLNYFYGHAMDDSALAMYVVGDDIAAFTRPTLTPFSNLRLVDNVLDGIRQRHGDGVDVFADYKFHNDLQKTDIRFILPTDQRIMEDTNMKDVPAKAADSWLTGIHLSNSLIGKGQTSLESYMFRYWCTNGCTTELGEVGKWSRRVNGQQDDVYAWARDSVDEILGGMEHRFDEVQALARLGVAGNTADILTEIFKNYEVPVSQRDDIMMILLEQENLTMYSIMQAITQVANQDDLDDRRRDRLMRIGGAIPTEQFDTLKARVWREGHSAKSTERNPYEVQVITI